MSRVCSICGRKPGFGNNRSHSMAATRRRFDPNLQRMRVLVDGVAKRAYVCTRCIKAGKVHKALERCRAPLRARRVGRSLGRSTARVPERSM